MEEKQPETIALVTGQVLCVEGEIDPDMYQVIAGKFLVCIRKGTELIPLAYIGKGEFIGELSYFDSLPRSADIISIMNSKVLRIKNETISELPAWLQIFCRYITGRIRTLDEATRKHGIKKKSSSALQPLTIEQQIHFLKLIKEHEARLLKK